MSLKKDLLYDFVSVLWITEWHRRFRFNLRFRIYGEDYKKVLKAEIFVLWGSLCPLKQANWYRSRCFGNVSLYPSRQANEALTLLFASPLYLGRSASGQVAILTKILLHYSLKDTRSSKEVNSKLRFNPASRGTSLFLSILIICIVCKAHCKAKCEINFDIVLWCCYFHDLLNR